MNTKKQIMLVGSGLVAGIIIGVVVTAVSAMKMMPSMMLETTKSAYGMEETVEKLEAAAKEAGWSVPWTMDIKASLAKNGIDFAPQTKVLKICKAPYAQAVLTTDRHLAAMMPCSIAVYEGDDGATYVSKMNTELMGKMFGGTVAEIMGGPVAREEKAMVATIQE